MHILHPDEYHQAWYEVSGYLSSFTPNLGQADFATKDLFESYKVNVILANTLIIYICIWEMGNLSKYIC